MRRRVFALTLSVCSAVLMSGAVQAQTGRIAYISTKDNAAYVAPADGFAAAKRLPDSTNVTYVSLSPADGQALYFTTAVKASLTYPSDNTAGKVSLPPYGASKPLGPPLDKTLADGVVWVPDGSTAFVNQWSEPYGRYTPGDGKVVKYPIPVNSASADGAIVVYTTQTEVRIRYRATGKEKVLFTAKNPQALFDAARRGVNKKKLQDFLQQFDPSMYKEMRNWAIGTPAITPDGKTIFFACNGGGGMGAAGNCTWAFFALDVATAKLSILSKIGEQFGRVPFGDCQVSPDGKRLLYSYSMHSNAMENPSSVAVIDLQTQTERVLVDDELAKGGSTNAFEGMCWSPDSKYVAFAIQYYEAEPLMQRLQNGEENVGIDETKFTIVIKNAATGKTVRKIPMARCPSWSK